jgi:hypothetical protein
MLFYHQNSRQNREIKITNRSFRNVTQFIHLLLTVRNQNVIQEKIKIRLNLGDPCYHSVQNLLSSLPLSNNENIRIYKTIVLPVVLYGHETWSLRLR